MIPGRKQVTLRPAGGLEVGLLVAVMAVFCVACAAVATFLGWLGLNMRVEVEPDAVRFHCFWPKPANIASALIADVRIGGMTRGGTFAPHLILVGGAARIIPPLTVRTEAQGPEQVAKLRAALRDVAPIA